MAINSATRVFMQTPPAEIGARFEDIDTPALILDLDALDQNLAKMAEFAGSAGIRLRPHAKTHRCPAIAKRQAENGAVGQCVQTVGEAEAMIEGGVRDILVSNQVVGADKLRRLASLAEEATVAVCFDSPGQVDAASRAAGDRGVELGGLVEIEVGMERCGVLPGPPARELARRIADSPNLKFLGLQAYNGKAQHIGAHEERQRAINNTVEAVRRTLDALEAGGLECEIVGGAGTGTFQFEAASGVYSELQVGSYVFMDAEYASITHEPGNLSTEFKHSLFVLATVISTPTSDHAILNAGLKSYTAEKGLPWVHGLPGVEVVGLSDEHAKLQFAAGAVRLGIGSKVELIPGHCDPTVNLHDWYVGVRQGRVEELWPITARGASR